MRSSRKGDRPSKKWSLEKMAYVLIFLCRYFTSRLGDKIDFKKINARKLLTVIFIRDFIIPCLLILAINNFVHFKFFKISSNNLNYSSWHVLCL